MRIGLFGGTFNPIHLGHLRAAEEARQGADLDKIVFIPSGNPPLKSEDLLDAGIRLMLVKEAIRDNPYFEVSDIETVKTEKSYTVETVKSFTTFYSDDRLFLVLGIDAFLDIQNWHRPERLIEMIDFVVLTRPGYAVELLKTSNYIEEGSKKAIETYKPNSKVPVSLTLISGKSLTLLNIAALNLSSTTIRELIRAGKSVRYLVPEAVVSNQSIIRF